MATLWPSSCRRIRLRGMRDAGAGAEEAKAGSSFWVQAFDMQTGNVVYSVGSGEVVDCVGSGTLTESAARSVGRCGYVRLLAVLVGMAALPAYSSTKGSVFGGAPSR